MTKPAVAKKAPKTKERVGGNTKADAVYNALVSAIVSRELTPGMKLSEETVAASFQINRVVVRAVLNRLHNDSLLELKPNRGAFVATPSPKQAREIFEARILLEREIAVRLAKTITRPQVEELKAHVRRQRERHQEHHDPDTLRLAEEFHLLVARLTDNEILLSMLTRLVSLSSLVLSLYGRRSLTNAECGLDEHDEIIEALRNHDARKSGDVMVRHLEHVTTRMVLEGKSSKERDLADILKPFAS